MIQIGGYVWSCMDSLNSEIRGTLLSCGNLRNKVQKGKEEMYANATKCVFSDKKKRPLQLMASSLPNRALFKWEFVFYCSLTTH